MHLLYSFIISLLAMNFMWGDKQEQIFKVEIEQNGKIIEKSRNKVKVKKAPLTFILTMPFSQKESPLKQIRFIATFNKKVFKRFKKGESLQDILGENNYPYALDIGNINKYIVLGDNGYSFWACSADSSKNLVNNYKTENQQAFCKVRIKDFLIDDFYEGGKKSISIENVKKRKIYFCFEFLEDNIVLKRENLMLKLR